MSDHYRAMPEGNLQQQFARYEKQRDDLLDVAIETADRTRIAATRANEQLKDQENLLDQANEALDRNNDRLKNLNSKMQDFLESTSDTCLYITIGIAGFVFLLLVSI